MTKMVDKGAIERLKMVASTPFERCTYTRAIELLEEAVKGGKKFEFPVRPRHQSACLPSSLHAPENTPEAYVF